MYGFASARGGLDLIFGFLVESYPKIMMLRIELTTPNLRPSARKEIQNLRLVNQAVEKSASQLLFTEITASFDVEGIEKLDNLANSRFSGLINKIVLVRSRNLGSGTFGPFMDIPVLPMDEVQLPAAPASGLWTTMLDRLKAFHFLKGLIVRNTSILSYYRTVLMPRPTCQLRELLESPTFNTLKQVSLVLEYASDYDDLLQDVHITGGHPKKLQVSPTLQGLFSQLDKLSLGAVHKHGRANISTADRLSEFERGMPGYAMHFIASIARNVEILQIYCNKAVLVLPEPLSLAEGGHLRVLDIRETYIPWRGLGGSVHDNLDTLESLRGLEQDTAELAFMSTGFLTLLMRAPNLFEISAYASNTLFEMICIAHESGPGSEETEATVATAALSHINKNRRERGLAIYEDACKSSNAHTSGHTKS